ncbi:MAG: sensor histidine kinase, partial [Cyanobacteriota bacterium]
SPPASLRSRLQSSSLLAVLAGYAVLLVVNQTLASLQRRQDHEQLISELQRTLPGRRLQMTRLEADRPELSALGLQLTLQPPGPLQPASLRGDSQGNQWLESTSPYMSTEGHRLNLRLRQNVTASVQREWIGQLLLIAAAGMTSLFTSGLLRLVLRRGLVQPLEGLGEQLAALNSRSLGRSRLPVAEQPQELQPIAAAFNDLQTRLAAAWERERSFVDGVAHELRTPITLISGRAQSLRRHAGAGPLAPALDEIAAEAGRMGLLVSDLLDLARQDADRLTLQRAPLDLEDALLAVVERLGRLAALIDNARRYTSGPIELYADRQGPWLVLHVRDHGPGVADGEKSRIFERFQRGAAAVNTRGSGVGLSVVQLLMGAMGGSVAVADAPAGGADFQLLLPPA